MGFVAPFVAPRRAHAAPRRCARHAAMAAHAPDEGRRPRRERRREHGMRTVTHAQRLARRGERQKALAMLRGHLTRHPNNAHAWLALGRMERDDEDAFAAFSEGALHCPDSAHLLHAWAVRCSRMGMNPEARKLFRSCIRLSPNDALAWQAYALLEERAGDVELARALFAYGARRSPGSSHLWSAWGALERRQNQHKTAIRYLTAANSIDPKHIKSLQMWALSAEELGKHSAAIQLFERALAVNPTSVPTLQAYALFKARRGDIDKARKLFSEAAEVDPRHAPVWHAWATMERNMGDTERARELFDTGVQARPYSEPMLRGWAEMELELGHIDSGPEWQVYGTETKRSLGENLRMLRKLLERRSNDDVAMVMQWLNKRANEDRNLYDRFAERGSSDSRLVKDWIERRSAEDVEAFKAWVTARYERDRQIGTFILNLDIPPLPVREPAVEKVNPVPREWYMLAEVPAETLQAGDEAIYYNGSARDYAEGVYFLGMIANNFADRAALVFLLGSVSLLLLGVSVRLEMLGYTPAGDKALESVELDEMQPRSGVDAYLYENVTDEMLSTAGGTLYKVKKLK